MGIITNFPDNGHAFVKIVMEEVKARREGWLINVSVNCSDACEGKENAGKAKTILNAEGDGDDDCDANDEENRLRSALGVTEERACRSMESSSTDHAAKPPRNPMVEERGDSGASVGLLDGEDILRVAEGKAIVAVSVSVEQLLIFSPREDEDEDEEEMEIEGFSEEDVTKTRTETLEDRGKLGDADFEEEGIDSVSSEVIVRVMSDCDDGIDALALRIFEEALSLSNVTPHVEVNATSPSLMINKAEGVGYKRVHIQK